MNKKGVELSVNFIVGFILALTMFGLGTALLYSIFSQATELHDMTEEQLGERMIQLQCSATDEVCISGNRVEKSRGDLAVFGIYIYNLEQSPADFKLLVTYDNAFQQDRSLIASGDQYIDIFGDKDAIVRIDPNTQKGIPMGLKIGNEAPDGKYSFNVEVTKPNGRVITRKIVLDVR